MVKPPITADLYRALLLGSVLTLALALSVAWPARAQNPPFRALVGHQGSVLTVQFTPDGKTLLSGSRDATIKLWNISTGQPRRTLTNHTADVYSVAFSHDGKLMASGSSDTRILLWNTATFEPIRALHGHTATVRDVAFSKDERMLASVGEDGTFRLWDVTTGTLKVTRSEHAGKVKSVAYYPDGSTIVTAAADRTLRMWDAHTGEPKRVLKGHSNAVEFCAVSPDGRQLFSGTGNIGQLIFWDARSGRMLCDLPDAHGNKFGAEIDSGCYSADGQWAISGSKDRTDKFWDPHSFKLLHTIRDNPGRTESMALSPDGKLLATGFGGTNFSIRLWDLSVFRAPVSR